MYLPFLDLEGKTTLRLTFNYSIHAEWLKKMKFVYLHCAHKGNTNCCSL